jgi:steroid delta-isomerase-like uncharacterized protein
VDFESWPDDAEPVTHAVARRFAGRFTAAWNTSDVDAFLALTTADVVWEDPSSPGRVATGHAAVGTALQTYWRWFPSECSSSEGLIPGDEDCVAVSAGGRLAACPWVLRGTWSGAIEPLGLAPTGAQFTLRGVDLWEFRSGLVCHLRTFFDSLDFADQLGLNRNVRYPFTRSAAALANEPQVIS